jgi:colanic acid/amylovoran biosynthesis glycosyltransferase
VKLIYVTSSLPFGPGEAFVIPEIVELMRRGHAVTIVPTYPRGPVLHGDAAPLLPATEAGPLLSAAIARDVVLELARSPLRVLRAWLQVRRSRDARILGKNLAVLAKGVSLGRAARTRRIEHLHAHWGSTSSTLALVASEVAGVPWSLTLHRWDIDEDNLLALKARRACFVRTINRIGLEKVRARVGETAKPAFVLHVGVDLPERPEPREAAAPGRILVAASLREVKGHVYLLEALTLLRDRGIDAFAELVGDGPLRPSLEQRTAELGLGRQVRFAGVVSHESLLEGFGRGRWDVALLASVVTPAGEHEGIPVSLLEAMSFGLPVIGTQTGGIPDLLEGGAGLLVPERDAGALADAIERLLTDGALRADLGTAGRQRVEERFWVRAVVAELERRFAACAAAA